MSLSESFRDVFQKENNVAEELQNIVSEINENDNYQLNNRFRKLRDVHQLQKSIVKQKMHNAMSPISAISGYLELINISLSNEPDVKQIEHYRKQIEAGVNQVNVILEQLMKIYSDESDQIASGQEVLLDVDLNWVVSEVCNEMNCAGPDVYFDRSDNPLHIRTDLFMAKLIIFNMISFAVKCTSKEELLQIKTSAGEDEAIFSVCFDVSQKKKEELIEMMSKDCCYGNLNGKPLNSFNDGLCKSRKLAMQMNGVIWVDDYKDELLKLNLSIPLSV